MINMNIARIKETCIYVSDLEKTKEFYGGKLKLRVISIVAGRHIFFQAGSSVLLCFIAAETKRSKELPPHGADGFIHFAFEVVKEEYALALESIHDAGINILHEHVWKGGVKSFYFEDPDRNLVEVIQQGFWEQY